MQWRIPIPGGGQMSAADTLNAIKSQPGLSLEIDRWLVVRALDVLREHRQTGKQVWLLITQTTETLIDPKTASWLREELRKRLLVGTGLIFKFNLVDMVTDIKSARNLLGDLSIMGIEMCLGRFGRNDASYKVLRYLKTPYVKITDKLLTADVETIRVLLQQTKEVNSRVILPKILDPKTIAKEWLVGADFVQSSNTRSI
jgi:EAL domain-containing protein (putative c-di-GMP-specific phosphodiesterase class I)